MDVFFKKKKKNDLNKDSSDVLNKDPTHFWKDACRVFSNKISKDTLKPGDHIYSWRVAYLYSHHGIYAGDGKVIHFTRGPGQEIGTGTFLDNVILSSSASSDRSKCPCPVCGDQSNLSGVISSCLDCFLWEGELYRFEYGVSPVFFLAKARGGTCTLAPSDPSEDALSRASFLLENGFGGYNIFKNNCEDFAIYCKTGLLVVTDISMGRSGQAQAAVAAVSAVVSSPLRFLTTSFSGLAAVGCGLYCVSRLVSDIGMRRDVMKVPVERLVNVNPIELDQSQIVGTETAKKEPMDSDHSQTADTETEIAKEDPIALDQTQLIGTETARKEPMDSDHPQSAETETKTAKEDPIALDQPQPVMTETGKKEPMDSDHLQSAETETEPVKEDPIALDHTQPAETESALLKNTSIFMSRLRALW